MEELRHAILRDEREKGRDVASRRAFNAMLQLSAGGDRRIAFSVCVPCWPNDTSKLRACLRSIREQTVPPIEVVIGHSEIDEKKAKRIRGWFADFPFSVKCVHTTEPQLAGANRNMAAKRISKKATHVCFFDADDTMHPRKLEVTRRVLLDHGDPVAFLHRYHRTGGKPISSRYDYENPVVLKGSALHKKSFRKPRGSVHFKLPNLHHSHITVRRSVCGQIDQREDRARDQDAFYIASIYEKYGKRAIAFANIPLSFYKPSANPNRRNIKLD